MAQIDGSYTGTTGYNDALERYKQETGSADGYGELTNYGQQFASMFYNLVGRNPNAEEASQFYQQIVAPHKGKFYGDQLQNLHDLTQQFVSDNFQQQAKDLATQQLQGQQAEAGRLADLYRTQGRQAISDTEARLQDYQSRLFEKLRPQLLTSLQSQGLLNTGGLNEAMAGAAGDLAASTSNYLSDAYLQNEQAANQIAFSGQAAPYQYQQQNILNQVPYLQQQGQTAAQNSYNSWQNDLNYQRQLNLMNQQAKIQSSMQPGLLGRLGQSFTTSLGTNLGNNFNGPAWMQSASKLSAMGG